MDHNRGSFSEGSSRRESMLYEVRILDPKGNLEKVIKEKELSKRFWKDFNERSYSTGKGKTGEKNKRRNS